MALAPGTAELWSGADVRPLGRLRSAGHRAVQYLAARPILILLLLSPGIPEYLSGSSPLEAIVIAPGWFVLQLALNLGLYGPGVLLIREARVRWKAGFLTVLLLGAAYAILEEGVALSTMFNPHASVVGALGSYGHFLGVNTVWVPGILMVHMVYSIGLPILLLEVALPATRGRSLVSDRQVALLLTILALDVALLFAVVYFGASFFMGVPLLAGSLGTIGLLIWAGRRYAGWRPNPTGGPAPTWVALVLGLALFPAVVVTEGFAGAVQWPAVLAIAFATLAMAGIALGVYRYVCGPSSRRRWIAFAFGALLPILIAGAATNVPYDIALVADAFIVLWFRRLRDVPLETPPTAPETPRPLPA